MSENRYLPMWMHRFFNGLFGIVLVAGASTFWLAEPSGSWRRVVSVCLLWASIPIGIILAAVAHRFSIVEGLAGDVGYEEDEDDDKKPSA
jgi:hypothetical protein